MVVAETPPLNFPVTFCCNCGDTDCALETQDTRVTGILGLASAENRFRLAIPVCARCRRSLRRPPATLLQRLLSWAVTVAVLFAVIWWLSRHQWLPAWVATWPFTVAAVLGSLLVLLFYLLRRPTPPQTSFHQPVRIRKARFHFDAGQGQITLLKLAFTNDDYRQVFSTANRAALDAKWLVVVKA